MGTTASFNPKLLFTSVYDPYKNKNDNSWNFHIHTDNGRKYDPRVSRASNNPFSYVPHASKDSWNFQIHAGHGHHKTVYGPKTPGYRIEPSKSTDSWNFVIHTDHGKRKKPHLSTPYKQFPVFSHPTFTPAYPPQQFVRSRQSHRSRLY